MIRALMTPFALRLAGDGMRVVVPYLRGFGPTRFRMAETLRSGEQAALGMDLIDLIEALELRCAIVAGYDWGGRAACVAAVLRPDLVAGLVTAGGYTILGAPVDTPLDPRVEHLLWYQYYLHLPRGRAMLAEQRTAFCRHLWCCWSPRWAFGEDVFQATAASFDNPDFVDVVLHSYRHRAGLVPGDPDLMEIAMRLEARPSIGVPTIALFGDAGAMPLVMPDNVDRFTGGFEARTIPGAGHNVPQEAPAAMAAAILSLGARC